MNAEKAILEFQESKDKAIAYAETVTDSLLALAGDGSFIHERNRHAGNIANCIVLLERAAKFACEPGDTLWRNTGQTQIATTWLDRLWVACDAAIGWMVRIAKY